MQALKPGNCQRHEPLDPNRFEQDRCTVSTFAPPTMEWRELSVDHRVHMIRICNAPKTWGRWPKIAVLTEAERILLLKVTRAPPQIPLITSGTSVLSTFTDTLPLCRHVVVATDAKAVKNAHWRRSSLCSRSEPGAAEESIVLHEGDKACRRDSKWEKSILYSD